MKERVRFEKEIEVLTRDIREYQVAPLPAVDSPVANRFIQAHHTRWCIPGNPGSATCRPLTSPRVINRIVIHTIAVPSRPNRSGVESVVLAWQRPKNPWGASAHYLVDRDGVITQMVRENNVAFHGLNANPDSIGIEHADVCNDPSPYTEMLYEKSAELVRDIASRRGIAINNNTVFGHDDARIGNHGDPGPYWDWQYYFLLLAWDGNASNRPIRQVKTVF
jgi:hypothetical protein